MEGTFWLGNIGLKAIFNIHSISVLRLLSTMFVRGLLNYT